MTRKTGPAPKPIPKAWQQAIDEWDEWMTVRGYTVQTRYLWRNHVGRFARAAGRPPRDVTSRDIIHYMARRAAPSTLRSYYSALNSFYAWITPGGAENPMTGVPLTKRRTVKLPPAPAEAADRARHTDERTLLMTLLMAYMGLRRGEVAAIHTRDITGHGSEMTLTVHGKGQKDRRIPVDAPVARLIDRARPTGGGWLFPSMNHSVASGRHITAGQVGKIVKDATGSPAHSFRRKFASDLWQATGAVMIVQQLLGHESLATTQTYIWTTQTQMRHALAKLDKWRDRQATRTVAAVTLLERYGVPHHAAKKLVRQITIG